MFQMKKTVYLDNGATTRVADEVVKAMLPFYSDNYGNASSLHTFGMNAKESLEEARLRLSKNIGCLPREIIFTSGGTESDNIAIKGFALANKEKGNHIITSTIEHPAVYKTLKTLEKNGFEITYLGVDKDGLINMDELKKKIKKETILVTIIHGNNEIGTIQDIDEIGKICKEKKVKFHTDAVQSFTKVPINVENVDMLSMSSHKIHGPKGIGALYIKLGTKLFSIVDGGSQEFKLKPGTENIPGIMGFVKAVELSNKKDIKKMVELRNFLIQELLKIPHTKLTGHPKERLCNNINIAFKYVEGESVLMLLDQEGIAVSTGSACSSHSLEPSHVLLAIGLKHEDAHGCIRFTLSKYTTKEELVFVIEKVKKSIERLRQFSPLVN